MGENVSTEYETNGWPTKKGSEVIAFHSSTKRRIHFEASKQTSKLISLISPLFGVDLAFKFHLPVVEFAEKYTDVDFIKIDVDELHEFGVQAMPSFMLVKRGKAIDKVVGAKREDLQKKIEKHRFCQIDNPWWVLA